MELISKIHQTVWDVPILRFFVGIAAIYISVTRHRKVWSGYPILLQCIMRPLSFLIGAVMISSLLF